VSLADECRINRFGVEAAASAAASMREHQEGAGNQLVGLQAGVCERGHEGSRTEPYGRATDEPSLR
jgi:hypothetical protein